MPSDIESRQHSEGINDSVLKEIQKFLFLRYADRDLFTEAKLAKKIEALVGFPAQREKLGTDSAKELTPHVQSSDLERNIDYDTNKVIVNMKSFEDYLPTIDAQSEKVLIKLKRINIDLYNILLKGKEDTYKLIKQDEAGANQKAEFAKAILQKLAFIELTKQAVYEILREEAKTSFYEELKQKFGQESVESYIEYSNKYYLPEGDRPEREAALYISGSPWFFLIATGIIGKFFQNNISALDLQFYAERFSEEKGISSYLQENQELLKFISDQLSPDSLMELSKIDSFINIGNKNTSDEAKIIPAGEVKSPIRNLAKELNDIIAAFKEERNLNKYSKETEALIDRLGNNLKELYEKDKLEDPEIAKRFNDCLFIMNEFNELEDQSYTTEQSNQSDEKTKISELQELGERLWDAISNYKDELINIGIDPDAPTELDTRERYPTDSEKFLRQLRNKKFSSQHGDIKEALIGGFTKLMAIAEAKEELLDSNLVKWHKLCEGNESLEKKMSELFAVIRLSVISLKKQVDTASNNLDDEKIAAINKLTNDLKQKLPKLAEDAAFNELTSLSQMEEVLQNIKMMISRESVPPASAENSSDDDRGYVSIGKETGSNEENRDAAIDSDYFSANESGGGSESEDEALTASRQILRQTSTSTTVRTMPPVNYNNTKENDKEPIIQYDNKPGVGGNDTNEAILRDALIEKYGEEKGGAIPLDSKEAIAVAKAINLSDNEDSLSERVVTNDEEEIINESSGSESLERRLAALKTPKNRSVITSEVEKNSAPAGSPSDDDKDYISVDEEKGSEENKGATTYNRNEEWYSMDEETGSNEENRDAAIDSDYFSANESGSGSESEDEALTASRQILPQTDTTSEVAGTQAQVSKARNSGFFARMIGKAWPFGKQQDNKTDKDTQAAPMDATDAGSEESNIEDKSGRSDSEGQRGLEAGNSRKVNDSGVTLISEEGDREEEILGNSKIVSGHEESRSRASSGSADSASRSSDLSLIGPEGSDEENMLSYRRKPLPVPERGSRNRKAGGHTGAHSENDLYRTKEALTGGITIIEPNGPHYGSELDRIFGKLKEEIEHQRSFHTGKQLIAVINSEINAASEVIEGKRKGDHVYGSFNGEILKETTKIAPVNTGIITYTYRSSKGGYVELEERDGQISIKSINNFKGAIIIDRLDQNGDIIPGQRDMLHIGEGGIIKTLVLCKSEPEYNRQNCRIYDILQDELRKGELGEAAVSANRPVNTNLNDQNANRYNSGREHGKAD